MGKDEGLLMNARMKLMARERASRFVVSADVAGADGLLQAGKWARLQNRLKRMLLLLQSPIASFRWARAKRKALAPKHDSRYAWLSPWTNSFAECERDGIVMGL
jgi:hypothetical protein